MSNVSMTREAWNDLMACVKALEKDQAFLHALQACGVDNWEGYSDAVDMLEDEED